MVYLSIILIFFGASLASRSIPATTPFINGAQSLVYFQLAVEATSLASIVYLAFALQWVKGQLSQSVIGFLKLTSFGAVTLQASLLASTLMNLEFSLSTALALNEYKGATVSTQGATIFIDGAIGEYTYDEIVTAKSSRAVNLLIIRSPGGLIEEALQISKLIRRDSLSVHVIDLCASACVIIASSSPHLTATPSSLFGFHQGGTIIESNSSLSKYLSLEATNTMIDALRDNGIPEEILDAALETQPSDMHYVSSNRMLDLGVVAALRP